MVNKISINSLATKIIIWAAAIITLIINLYIFDNEKFNMYISIHTYIPLNIFEYIPLYVYIVCIIYLSMLLAFLFSDGSLTKKSFIVILTLTTLIVESFIVSILYALIIDEIYYNLF